MNIDNVFQLTSAGQKRYLKHTDCLANNTVYILSK